MKMVWSKNYCSSFSLCVQEYKMYKYLCVLSVRSMAARGTGKNNGFPFLGILGYLKNTHKSPKFGRVRQVPIWELSWEFPGWDLSHFAKFGIFRGILQAWVFFKYPKISKKWESIIFSCWGWGRVLPYERLMGMCCWMGSHFQESY